MIIRAVAALAAASPLAYASTVFAQEATPLVAAPEPNGRGVISYPPAFFADAQPTTALEMVERLPGFALDVGDDVRGFEGAAG
ncbi:MAG: TonB-dependent receptor, partial [Pseudomonadota bacterium]